MHIEYIYGEREREMKGERKIEREKEIGGERKKLTQQHSSGSAIIIIFVINYSAKILHCSCHYNKFDEAINGGNYMKLSSSIPNIYYIIELMGIS